MSERDFTGWLRELIREQTGLEGEALDHIEHAVRHEWGGRNVYVQRRRKADHLRELAKAPPDADPQALAGTVGLSARQVYRYLALLERD